MNSKLFLKKTSSLALGAFLFSVISSGTPAYALNSSVTPTLQPSVTGKKDVKKDPVLRLKDKGVSEIDRRLTELTKVSTQIDSFKRLTDIQKTGLKAQVTTEISNLTALKSKITADVDLPTLRADVKSIVSSYRVFALFIPKIHLLAASTALDDSADTLSELAVKLNTRIQTAAAQGKDVTSLQTLLADMQTKVADAKTQSATVTETVINLVPEGYPGNRSSLTTARDLLKKGREDVQAAHKTAVTIVNQIKAQKPSVTGKVIKPSITIKPSVTSTTE